MKKIGKTPTIYEIKRLTQKENSYYFTPATMIFFNQRLSDFKVKISPKGNIFIYAPITEKETGKLISFSIRLFDPKDQTLNILPIRFDSIYQPSLDTLIDVLNYIELH